LGAGWEGNTFVTAVRNKIAVLPSVDKDLNCIYKSDVSVAMTDGSSKKLNTKNLNLKSRIQ